MINPVVNIIFIFSIIASIFVLVYGLYSWWKNEEEDEDKLALAKKIVIFSGGFLGVVLLTYLGTFLMTRKKVEVVRTDVDGDIVQPIRKTVYACDKDAALPGCQVDSSSCASGEYCSSDCACEKQRFYGENCDNDAATPSCDASSDSCAGGLHCEVGGSAPCTCQGAPLVDSITPSGGFCLINEGGAYKQTKYVPCLNDSDCLKYGRATKCDLTTPNGAPGSFVTISGRYFGSKKGQVFFSDGLGGRVEAKLASNQSGGNIVCGPQEWRMNQVVAIVPMGAAAGPITLKRDDGGEGMSSTAVRGVVLPDFLPNTILRPGVCDISPEIIYPWQSVSVNGVNLKKSIVFLRRGTSTINALGSSFANQFSGTAQIPQFDEGKVSVFARVGKISGNFFEYEIGDDKAAAQIGSFWPLSGTTGSYITINGRNFGNSKKDKLGVSYKVYFDNDLRDNDDQKHYGQLADFSFPVECANDVWRDDRLIVKVPEGLVDEENYYLVIRRFDWLGEISSQHILTTTKTSAVFKYDKDARLGVGICRIEPILGRVGEDISIWGEHFNAKSVPKAEFFSSVFSSGKLSIGKEDDARMSADKYSVKVPGGALSGSVSVGGSNSLNFSLGLCTEQLNPDTACGSQICCPDGTLFSGKCQSDLAACRGVMAPKSVYAWTFTNINNGKGSYDLSRYSCGGYDKMKCSDSAPSLKCPNSEGRCVSVQGDAGSECKCCCEKGKSGQCCAGLTCDGACSGEKEVDKKYGSCTGCAVKSGGKLDQTLSDQACNCAGSSGKFCDTNNSEYPQGVCIDCAAISSPEECTKHERSCCVDGMKGGVCRGGKGDRNLVSTDDFAYCTYFVRNKNGSNNGGSGSSSDNGGSGSGGSGSGGGGGDNGGSGSGGGGFDCYPVATSNSPIYDNLSDCQGDNGGGGSGDNGGGGSGDNGGTDPVGTPCDENNLQAGCQIGGNCANGLYCSSSSCTCEVGTDPVGTPCDENNLQAGCQIGGNCANGLRCDISSCTCQNEVDISSCLNPWPARSEGQWSPWFDNSTNFQLYYCRDSGSAGTEDDLPALMSVPGAKTNDPDFIRQFFFHF